MRSIIRNLTFTGLSGLLCLALALPADAQRGAGGPGGGGGGGGRSSGGGGGGGFSGGGGRGAGGGGFSGGGGARQSFGGGNAGGGARQSFGGGNSGGGRQSMGTVNPGRQSFGGANPGGGRQSFGGANPGASRQSIGGANPGAGRQSFGGVQPGSRIGSGRTQGLQGNTRGFNNNNNNRVGASGRPSFGGTTRISPNRGNYNNHAGANRGYYSNGRSYYGRNFYYGGRANYGRGYNTYSPWASRNGYYYNRGYYSSLYYPRLGLSFGYLPYGYYPFYWGDMQFYYSSGLFYQYNNNQYTVVEPPVGAAINTLPSNAESIVINGVQYYQSNGVYYQPVTKDDGTTVYQVAGKDGKLETDEPTLDDYNSDNGPSGSYNNMGPAPQIGDIVSQLPDDTRKININGQKYLVSPDDFYYQETRDNNNDKVYKVVGTPDDAPGN